MKKPPVAVTGIIPLFLFFLSADLYADTLYLKNGRAIEGIIKNEEPSSIELDVGFGTVKFYKSEVERIYRSNREESSQIHRKWEQVEEETQQRNWRQRQEKESQESREVPKEPREPQQVQVQQDRGHIVVSTVLNGSVPAKLFLDTGATLVMLSNQIGRQLGFDVDSIKDNMKMELADGRKIDAKFVILESVSVEDVEAKNVGAAILMEEVGDASFKDGLLGMSFLKNFNFKVDSKAQKLILEKLD